MDSHDAGAFFRQGRLAEAIAAAASSVQKRPADVAPRLLLAELLLFAGEFKRADDMMAAAEAIEPGAALVVAEFRQLLRAATARRQLFGEGRLPEFLGEPTESQKAALGVVVALRDGDDAGAAAAAEAAERLRPSVSGQANGAAFEDFRDADDLCGGSLEVLTTTGKYFWAPLERVVSMELHPQERPRDLFWRRCTLTVRDGPQGDVYLPALYDGPTADDELRLGRRTDWTDTAPVRGSGQRIFLAGDDGVALGDLRSVEFA
ncbi:type VI secretion system accessory protein TagJ [Hansschlegelia beijingensis]|uniref:Type VI secretion system protein ImpE n=1 Tax=Hansschlegelia beijingensis TaxID=1133344 RepID=A0A7W6CVC5_9HYPH|nr:type VI secretion system accessory protein TagJ [Hansschlegelia beijingensis]MBB3971800.1 type VI secretion system protein ImpE [Hansschlegelia beijingensis]